MAIQVYSEIGRLRRVMLHRPGRELEELIPGDLERMLFDDIPYLRAAQAEHDHFASILREEGVEVVYLEDLMAEVIRQNPLIKQQFLREFIGEGNVSDPRVRENLLSFLMETEDDRELVLKLMSGVRVQEMSFRPHGPLVRELNRESRFLMDPMPNLYFTRDPFACIGGGVSLNRMYSHARRRETIFGKYILMHHPEFAGKVPFYYHRDLPYSIEGGDVFNLSEKVLAVGISQRTTPEAVELLAERMLTLDDNGVEIILAFDIPSVRAYMHLDTVFTQVDVNAFTIHPRILQSLRIFEITRKEPRSGGAERFAGSGGSPGSALVVREMSGALEEILAQALQLDHVSLIRCGGRDAVTSEREQWNDGSNTLCVAPGRVIVYDRNIVTNQILRDHGIEVLEMPSSELSRGRGGPRCMSMPLDRDPV